MIAALFPILTIASLGGWLGGGLSGLDDAFKDTIGKVLAAVVAVAAILATLAAVAMLSGSLKQGSFMYRLADGFMNTIEAIASPVANGVRAILEAIAGLIPGLS